MATDKQVQSLEVFDGPDMWTLFTNGLAQQSWIRLGIKIDGKRYKVDCHVEAITRSVGLKTWVVDFSIINFASFAHSNSLPEWFIDMMRSTKCFFRIKYELNGNKGSCIPSAHRDQVLVNRSTVSQLHLNVLPKAATLFSNLRTKAINHEDPVLAASTEILCEQAQLIATELRKIDHGA